MQQNVILAQNPSEFQIVLFTTIVPTWINYFFNLISSERNKSEINLLNEKSFLILIRKQESGVEA